MKKILVVGGSGFIGKYVMKQLPYADNLDLKEDHDVRWGIARKYHAIVFLACNQADTQYAFSENIEMYDALHEYMSRHPFTRLVYISSAAVYYGGNFYSESKRVGETYARLWLNSIILRLSNVYGHGDGHGAPDRFQRGEKTINGDGTQVRDLVAVEVVILAILSGLNSREIGTFNISSGVGTTVNQMFEMFGSGKPVYNGKSKQIGVHSSILTPGRVI